MHIKILGTGCPNCQRLEANVKQALQELNLEAQVEKVTEIQDIMSYGVMGTPALVLNGKVEAAGRIPDADELKKILSKK